jgi:membrane protein DedA with SNARE-associated domain
MLEQLASLAIGIIEHLGYLGVFVTMALNSNFVPLHSEVILPFSGFLTSEGKFYFPLVVAASVLGDIAGALLGYFIGYLLEETVVIALISKYGKFIFLNVRNYEKTMVWIKKYGFPIILAAKFTPGLKSLSNIVCGMAEIKLSKFLLAVIIASLTYSIILTYLGYYLGENWNFFSRYAKHTGDVVILLVIALASLFVIKRLRKKLSKS